MRKFAIIFTIALLVMSCKTNEKNMNDAYVRAIAGRENDNPGLDSTIYSQIRREMNHNTMVVNGDSVDVSTQWLSVTEGGGGIRENLKRYNIAVGQFKQLFNAKSMRERLLDMGYPGAFVVQTREPYYYVIAASLSDVNDAVTFLHKVEKDPQLKMKSPLPFILEPAQHRR